MFISLTNKIIFNVLTIQINIYDLIIIFYRWQARREGDKNMRAGLIPSRALQERRIIHDRQSKPKSDSDKPQGIISKYFIKHVLKSLQRTDICNSLEPIIYF